MGATTPFGYSASPLYGFFYKDVAFCLMKKIKIVLIFFGIFIIYFLLKNIGFSVIAKQIKSMGWAFVFLMFFPVLLQEILFALAWQYSINGRIPDFFKIFLANIAGESVSYITPGAFIAGEPLRAILLRHHAGVYSSTASVIISRTTRAISMVVFVAISLLVSLYFFQMPLLIKSALAIVLALLSVGIFIFLYMQKIGIFANIIKWANRLKLPEWVKRKVNHFIEKKGSHLLKLDNHLIKFYKNEPGRFYFSLTVSVVGWATGAFEIYLFLKFLGMPVSIVMAMVIEALSLVINTCFLFMPGKIGTQEAGKVFIFKIFGMLAETGLTVGLLRRIREIIWVSLGLGIFAFYKSVKAVEQQ